MSKPPLSAFIIARDEADRIALTIRSLRGVAEEVIVVDSGSTDGTQQAAEAEGARVIFNAWPGYGQQKRFAEEQCRHDWLLNLDADEELSASLVDEIRDLFSGGPPPLAGYVMPVMDMLPGEAALSRYSHVNPCLRLYDRRRARFSASPVHDSVVINEGEGQAGHLAQPVLHRSFRSLAHALEKMNRYTSMQAEDMRARGKRPPAWRVCAEFPFAFVKVYFLRRYCMRGMPGFAYALVYALGRVMRLAKARE